MRPCWTQGIRTALNGKRLVFGIDAGGTSVRIALADAHMGTVLYEARAGADPSGGPEPLLILLPQMFAQTGTRNEHVSGICAGIAKWSRDAVRPAWENALLNFFPNVPALVRQVLPDYVTAFRGAIPVGAGVMVISGTGSVAYGETATGSGARVGGRGWEWGDEGSGAWLTIEAMRRTLRALDGLETLSPLTNAVCDFLETRDPALLGEAARRQAEQNGRGFLVPLVLSLAQNGDKEAVNLFVGTAGWLAAYARAAVQKLHLPIDTPLTVSGVGGLWEASGPLLSVPFQTVLSRFLPNAVCAKPDAAPVIGAVRIAQGVVAEQFRAL